MKNRHLRSPDWTREEDALLQKLEREGIAAEKIAARLGITPSSVQRRSLHLRGIKFPPQPRVGDVRGGAKARLRARETGVLAAMHKAIRAIPQTKRPREKVRARNDAIARARKAGASLDSLSDELGVTRVTIWRILSAQRLTRSMARTDPERMRAALAAMRKAIGKGVARDRAIAQAYAAGATLQAIADALGLTRQRVHQIVLWQEALRLPAQGKD